MIDQPGCNTCKHFQKKALRCAAFPDGIPWIILSGTIDHLSPLPGDNGIQYEPIDEEPANGINNDNGNG